MNITSAVVGISLMSTAMPMVANMTIQPLMAQKRAENFAVAESAAVGYAAKNEGVPALTPLPDNCSTAELEGNAYTVTCWHGEEQFKQSVSRSFRLAALCEDDDCDDDDDYDSRRVYTPGIFCPLWDPWGVINYNDSHNVQCIPVPYGPWASTYDGEMLW